MIEKSINQSEKPKKVEEFKPNKFSRTLLAGIFGVSLATSFGIDTIIQPQMIKAYLDPNIGLDPAAEHILRNLFNHVGNASVGIFIFGLSLVGEAIMKSWGEDRKEKTKELMGYFTKISPYILTTLATLTVTVWELKLPDGELADVPAGLVGIIGGALCFEEFMKWVKQKEVDVAKKIQTKEQ